MEEFGRMKGCYFRSTVHGQFLKAGDSMPRH